MDALLSTYASSDEEEDQQPPPPPPSKPSSVSSSSTSSLFSSLPKPKPQSSSSFSQLKQTLPKKPSNFLLDDDVFDLKPASKTSSVFSSLPPPKTLIPKPPITNPSPSAAQTPKRVVQFKPPMLSHSMNSSQFDDEEDDKEDEKRRRRKAAEEELSAAARTSSGMSRFSLPAPKYSAPLGGASLGSGSGSGRRAIVDMESVGSGVESNSGSGVDRNVASQESYAGYESYQSGIDQDVVNYESYGRYENYQSGMDQNVDAGVQSQAGVNGSDVSTYGSYDGYGSYGGYSGYEQYGNDLVGESGTVMPVATAGTRASGINVSKKRGRNEVPTEIIEVKQDELMKNRPREDQAKSTGIAFGPSYQPVSTKGKPSKLHKRKHQISSLYFDMRQKEMELAERRSRGFLTKAETQAKYGW